MDPNAALAKIREALAVVQPEIDHEHWDDSMRYSLGDDLKEAIESLAEHVGALDEWLSRGGFQPEAWASEREIRTLQWALNQNSKEIRLRVEELQSSRRGE